MILPFGYILKKINLPEGYKRLLIILWILFSIAISPIIYYSFNTEFSYINFILFMIGIIFFSFIVVLFIVYVLYWIFSSSFK